MAITFCGGIEIYENNHHWQTVWILLDAVSIHQSYIMCMPYVSEVNNLNACLFIVYCLLCFNPHVCSAPENKQTNKTSIIGITIAIECKWQKPTETQVFGLVWSPWQSAHKKLGAAFIDMRALLLLLLLRGWRGHAAPYQLPHIVYCHKGWQDERCGNQIGLKSLIGPNAGSSLIRAQREWRISAAHYLH